MNEQKAQAVELPCHHRASASNAILSVVTKMTCSQLGGACDVEFSGNSFAEIASQSQIHGKALFDLGDAPHIDAMSAMMEIINRGEMDAWMAARKAEFDSLKASQ